MRTSIGLALAFLGCSALVGCDRATPPERSGATVGQRLDAAIDKTQQKLSEAGQKTEQTLEKAGASIATATDRAVAQTREAARDVKDSAVLAAGEVKAEARSGEPARIMSDTAITASIKTDFLKDPDLSVLKIDVDTRDGVVTLNGLADNEPAKRRAEKIAAAIKGVKEVRNFLAVKRA